MKRFDDYLIVTDLDGTLYKRQNEIPQVNIDAIKRFTDLGGKFAVATGRGIEASRFITQAVNIPNPTIVNNGHTIYDFNTDKIVYNVYLPDDIKRFAKLVYERFPSVGIEIYSDRDLFVINDNEVVRNHLDYEMVERDYITFEQAEKIKWSKLLFAEEPDKLEEIIEYAKSLESGEFSECNFETIRTSSKFNEGVCKDVNKGTAVHELAKILNVPQNHIFTIGNFYNDIELVSCAFGAWINGTPQELLHYGKYITEKTCENGGFAEFLEYIMSEK